mmetsp:Transcript_9071/g.23250  ORF Transcript_9071/g.23250 Transcript_9071/m.23250 type:complete len:255 (+) Transcript_9071:72-836(+)
MSWRPRRRRPTELSNHLQFQLVAESLGLSSGLLLCNGVLDERAHHFPQVWHCIQAACGFGHEGQLPLLHLGVWLDAGYLVHEHRLRQALVARREDDLLGLLQKTPHLGSWHLCTAHEEHSSLGQGLLLASGTSEEIQLHHFRTGVGAAVRLPPIGENVWRNDDIHDLVAGPAPRVAAGVGLVEEDAPDELRQLAGASRSRLRARHVRGRLEVRIASGLEKLLGQLLTICLLRWICDDLASTTHRNHLGNLADVR